MSVEGNISIIKKYLDVVVRGNMQATNDYCTDDYIYHGSGGVEIKGVEGIKKLAVKYYTAFPNFRVILEDIFGEGDKVISRYKITGTHKGEYMGIKATGKEVEFDAVFISHFKDGKVAEDWAIYDILSLMQQLGVSKIGVRS